ncbi:FhaA domain-containing protein [Anaerotardibacter muris]|uniref:FhaA domain-containing protein n=1 Tax=Anaerotardibacter muris TaxID=2941505 RepID=UPI00203D391A|nr:DUF3662 and FHA domain-containing protein [Anaerotardibacter muris]
MGLFSKLERRVEDSFEGMNDKLFDAPISPVQITKKAEKQMRREKMVGAGKEYAPTLYTVLVNPDDDRRLFGMYPTLAGETETYLRAKANEEGWVMDGAPLVRFMVDDNLRHGKFDVIAELVSAPIVAQLRNEELERYGLAQQSAYRGAGQVQPGYHPQPQQPVGGYASSGIDVPVSGAAGGAGMAAAHGAHQAASVAEPIPIPNTVMFDQEPQAEAQPAAAYLVNVTTDRSFPLSNSRVLIGRATNCDIVLDDLNASRTHAEIFRESPTVWGLADLGSTNGTLVNGKHIASVLLNDGDRITVGTTTFVFTFQ